MDVNLDTQSTPTLKHAMTSMNVSLVETIVMITLAAQIQMARLLVLVMLAFRATEQFVPTKTNANSIQRTIATQMPLVRTILVPILALAMPDMKATEPPALTRMNVQLVETIVMITLAAPIQSVLSHVLVIMAMLATENHVPMLMNVKNHQRITAIQMLVVQTLKVPSLAPVMPDMQETELRVPTKMNVHSIRTIATQKDILVCRRAASAHGPGEATS